MPKTLDYCANDRDHNNIANDLGLLQGNILKKRTDRNTPNAYFIGKELEENGVEKLKGTHYLKKDLADKPGMSVGKGRTKRRVIVRVNDNTGVFEEDLAWIWDHEDGIKILGTGFFKKAQDYRSMVVKGQI